MLQEMLVEVLYGIEARLPDNAGTVAVAIG